MRITIAMFLAPIMAMAAEGDSADIRRRVEKSLALLQSSGVQFVKKSGCISCHHQSLPGMAVALARQKGVAVNGEIARQQTRATAALFSPHRENLLQAINTVPASEVVASYALVHMAAENYPADKLTDAIVHDLAQKQRADGSWRTSGDRRPPLANSDVTATALSLRSLDLYGAEGRKPEFAERIARARRWLASQEPDSSEKMSLQLMGLHWAKAPRADIDKSVRRLLAAQRPDGGWAQLPTLSSDAYATGQALVALGQAGGLVTDAAYQRGVAYLLKNQQEDGSWHVRSRAMGFQPYFESGFPHGHDQWISAAATSWATMALTLTL